MHEYQMRAFTEELESIQKQAAGWGGLLSGVGKFFRGGASAIGQLGSKAGRTGLMQTARNLPSQLRAAYQHGGGIGGVGRVLSRSAPVQAAALGAGGLYAGSKAVGMLRGGQQQQQ